MTLRLSAHGITADLPDGWDGRITRRLDPSPATKGAFPAEREYPLAHLGNFALPEQRGDFGSGAVDLMDGGNVFISLFEHGPESVGTALFARQGMPRRLRPSLFSAARLQRTLRGQAGAQFFFTDQGRAFCLYVVLGAQRRAEALVPIVNRTLEVTRIDAP
ncbi:hypothetical protein BH20ACT2_BH20ACT2_07140 [soil metagenome]